RRFSSEPDWRVISLDKLTDAGSLDSVADVSGDARYQLARMDILDGAGVRNLLLREQPDAIMHLAAESYVDRSIDGPAPFIDTNIVGTYRLLQSAYAYWRTLDAERSSHFRFHHISTDEVYGSLDNDRKFHEASPYRPTSPYSASKSASDHLARA